MTARPGVVRPIKKAFASDSLHRLACLNPGVHNDALDQSNPPSHGARSPVVWLSIGALGVVYGDIGTNPLFAMREAFTAKHHVELTSANVTGLLSLMFWSLIAVVTVKYLTVVMRADNDGEGGILALAALATGKRDTTKGRGWLLVLVGIFGAALLYGDGMVTPAISVLAAVEGTTVASSRLTHWVVPIACVIIVALFAVQHKGTAVIGRVFGPVMIVWFATIAALGIRQIVMLPGVLWAIWPGHAVRFFVDNGMTGFLVLGAVILVVVGGEALYADMGHFGRRPIMVGWYVVVLPALVCVYFGQGALLIRRPETLDNPFFNMAPRVLLYPLVVLATAATVIASQALISGAFSLTHQAIQLGYSPRVQVRHTSSTQIGQIYLPTINWMLMVACLGLVVAFRKSANLAAAYGVAVSTTMVMTTVLFAVVAGRHFGWRRSIVVPICAFFLVVDIAFFVATLFKVVNGGWFPLLVGAVIFTVMTTWRTGRRIVRERVAGRGPRLAQFVDSLSAGTVPRTKGASAFLYSVVGATPPSLLAAVRHTDALHETVLVVCVVTQPIPRVPASRRSEVTSLGHGVHQVVLRFGFMDRPDVPKALRENVQLSVGVDVDTLSYFLSRENIKVTQRPGMRMWREHLYAFISRNATGAARAFNLPTDQTLELGIGVDL